MATSISDLPKSLDRNEEGDLKIDNYVNGLIDFI